NRILYCRRNSLTGRARSSVMATRFISASISALPRSLRTTTREHESMKAEVSTAIEELKRQFTASSVTASEDSQGGAYVLIDALSLGPRFRPERTWMGFQIPAQYPYADIYPVFIGAETTRT